MNSSNRPRRRTTRRSRLLRLLVGAAALAVAACALQSQRAVPQRVGFANEEAAPGKEPTLAEWIDFYRQWLGRYASTPRRLPPWQLAADQIATELQSLDRHEGHVWLGHATVLLNMGGRKILFDPFLSEHYGPLPLPGLRRKSPVPVAADRLPLLDAVVVSHDHYDHLDKTTVKALLARQPQLRFVVPTGLAPLLRAWGPRR